MSTADDRFTARRALIVIGLVLATLVGLALVWQTRLVLGWLVAAAFLAVALNPLVNRVQQRLVRRRAAAALLVFLAALVVLAALTVVLVVPLVNELARFAHQAPDLLREVRAGRGPVGELLERFHVRRYAEAHADEFRRFGGQLGRSTLGLARGAAQGVAGMLSVVVLAYLIVVQTPQITARTLALAGGGARAERLHRVGRESARTITGYVSGNLLISLICGVLTFVVLVLTGVPYAAVVALLVAVADLIPMVGATLGAIVAGGAGFLHSPTAGVIVLVFFVVYQQFENHVLQPAIMSHAVQLNPLTVLVSVLAAAQLGGLVGALLAIPAAGIVKILLREFVPATHAGPDQPPHDPGHGDQPR
ncbi:AI-2E family transporter [Micromonospora terminaliae]|uniref:AI-2E family transporter n=1 Tax=Micromonospora terminaliae TaxID=1914461 RepID=A0AAJ2ZEQ7_9ACTN|nr:AI-2E family transporter [Micromonospora terminaliae]NES27954.1 AI-2E family transporter [Micromonospora terminaliae]QGL47281.1 AI-2E family transporter [Micromonospora terminaliae]